TVRDTYNLASVNLSLGAFQFPTFCDDDVDPGMFTAVQNLKDEGVTTVVASGNDGVINALGFPACLSNVISVGSVLSGKNGTQADAVANTSNAAPFLRMLAPGSPITSAIPGNAVGSSSGTSMAAPHVAGAIAVLRDGGADAGVAEVDRVDHLHGVLRASGPCVHDVGVPDGEADDFARLDVKAALDFVGVPSALFWDVECGKWFEEASDWLGLDPDGTPGPMQPLAAGYPDGSFQGNNPITRGQDARMVYRLFGEQDPAPFAHSFVDVANWLTEAVNWINWPNGPGDPDPLMSGYGNEFRPNNNITRAEKARQLHRAAGSPEPSCPTHPFIDVPPWVEPAVRWLTCPADGVDGITPLATGNGN
ncbi:MAG: S8 family serine peptidase, partial [Actinomycetota bacterium]